MSKKIPIYLARLQKYFKKLDRVEQTWYGILVFAIFVLVVALFRFTIIDHKFYQEYADRQQKMTERNPSARGNISSSSASTSGIVAVSTNLGTLAIDPTQSGSTVKLLDFLSDAVMTEFCLHRNHEECLQNIADYTRQDSPFEAKMDRIAMKSEIIKYLEGRIQSPIESVIIEENLDDATINKINTLSSEALFFVVNNLYVNPTKVTSPDLLSDRLSRILNIPKERILKKMEIRQKRHLEIIRTMSVATRDLVDNFLTKNREITEKFITEAYGRAKAEGIPPSEARKKVIAEYAVYPFIKIEDNFVRYYPE